MKLLGIIGSLRNASYNRAIFNHYQNLAKGHELIEGKHDDFPLYNDDVRESGMPACVLRLADQIRQAEGVLFFTPEVMFGTVHKKIVEGNLKDEMTEKFLNSHLQEFIKFVTQNK